METSKPDKRGIRAAFQRAAETYDAAAVVQREVCRRLLAFADRYPVNRGADRIVDAGCGTGYAVGLLGARFPNSTIIAMDFAPAMLQRLPVGGPGRRFPLCADVEQLPLATQSVDAVWSSLSLQWCDSRRSLAELARVLRPGGRIWLATLGPHTLWELRDAFSCIDTAQHVIHFESLSQLTELATAAGLEVEGHECPTLFALASDVPGLLRDIKAIGAHQVGPARRRRPLGKHAWHALVAHYERHRRTDGLLPATYDVTLLALAKTE